MRLIVIVTLQNKDREALNKFGGTAGLTKALRTDLHQGLDASTTGDTSVSNRKKVFGSNTFKEVPQKPFFALLFDNLQDPTLILLMAAALVSFSYEIQCFLWITCLRAGPKLPYNLDFQNKPKS